MALRGLGGGGGGHHGHHGSWSGYAPPWAQVGYPVAYQFFYGANQCADTYCEVHSDRCPCTCPFRKPMREMTGGGMFGPGPHHHRSAYGFRSPWGVPLPAEVWWAQRCPDTTCPKHKDMCGCECPWRVPKGGRAKPASWDEHLSGIPTFDKVLGVAAVAVIGAAFVLPAVQKALKRATS